MQRIRARFVGSDGSLGYRSGEVYDLLVGAWYFLSPMIISPVACPYDSWTAFYSNWTPTRWEKSDAEV